MTQASTKTYKDKENKFIRISHEKKILRHFQNGDPKSTVREAARAVNLPYASTQKRINDLINKDSIKVVGSISEDGNPNSIYTINRAPQIFRKTKKTRIELMKTVLDKYLDSGTYAAIMEEYERMLKLEKKTKK